MSEEKKLSGASQAKSEGLVLAPESATPAEAMFESDTRIEAMIWMPGLAICDESFPDVFSEGLCEALPEEADARLYRQCPALARFADGDEWPEPTEVAEALRFMRGFIFQAATPLRRYTDGGSYYSGWGNYYTAWLYAPEEAFIAPVCAEWAEAMHAKDKAAFDGSEAVHAETADEGSREANS